MWLSMRFLPMKMLLSNMIISDVILTCQLLIAWGYSHFIFIGCLESETCRVLVRRYLDLIRWVNLVKRYPIVAIEYEKMKNANAVVTLLEKWPENIQAVSGIQTHDLCVAGAMLYQLSYQSHMRAAVSGFGPLCSVDVILDLSIRIPW